MNKLFEAGGGKPIDPTELAANLSHQVEELTAKVTELQRANEEWRLDSVRHRAVSDAFKALIVELHIRPGVGGV